jgi:hypothetical protein
MEARTFTLELPRVLQSDATLQLIAVKYCGPLLQLQFASRPSRPSIVLQSHCLLLSEHRYGYSRVSSTPSYKKCFFRSPDVAISTMGRCVLWSVDQTGTVMYAHNRVPCLSICSLTDHVDCISFHGTSGSRSYTCIPAASTTTGTPSCLAFVI